MAALLENALTKITKTLVNMKAGSAATTLYTPPDGKTFYPIMVIIRNNTASLAGGTDYDFTTWRQTVDLSGMTATTNYRVIESVDNTSYTGINGTTTSFVLTKSTGCTDDCTATIDVIGYLVTT